jgi:hypothetical protein
MLRHPLPVALSLLIVVVASACEVRTNFPLVVADDGSGTVEVAVDLDAEAVAQLPDLDGDGVSDAADLAALVRDDDLVAAGWTVEGPDTGDDGGVRLQANRTFGTPGEADRVLAELTGPSGALRDLGVTRSESFGRTRYRFEGTADLSGGLEAFGDEGLAAALEGEALGEDAAAIEERIGRPLADTFTLEVTARLPGGSTSWSPRLGDAPLDMRSDSTSYDWPVLGLALVAVVCLGALVAVLVLRVVRSRRRAGR